MNNRSKQAGTVKIVTRELNIQDYRRSCNFCTTHGYHSLMLIFVGDDHDIGLVEANKWCVCDVIVRIKRDSTQYEFQ